MKYGYARVSTYAQANNGNSLESQREILEKEGCQEIVIDAYTGTKVDRPNFTKLIAKLDDGDILVVTKLDRFARSVTQGSKLVNDLIEKGVKVHILNIGIMDNTPASKLVRNIFFSFAEFERDMIVERTQEGKAIAKQSPDYKEGRKPKYTNSQKQHAAELKLSGKGYKEVERITGICKQTLYRYMRDFNLLQIYNEEGE